MALYKVKFSYCETAIKKPFWFTSWKDFIFHFETSLHWLTRLLAMALEVLSECFIDIETIPVGTVNFLIVRFTIFWENKVACWNWEHWSRLEDEYCLLISFMKEVREIVCYCMWHVLECKACGMKEERDKNCFLICFIKEVRELNATTCSMKVVREFKCYYL